ncbi:hypothetical protein KAR91_84200 [Candidatus Pacearchaeota archaeon]|nr:hypothetical protein [Candidatus Pacearchaeota archaeon]
MITITVNDPAGKEETRVFRLIRPVEGWTVVEDTEKGPETRLPKYLPSISTAMAIVTDEIVGNR